jgi:hypothetical protein
LIPFFIILNFLNKKESKVICMREFEIILLQTQRFIDKASIEAYITYNNNSGHFLRIRQWGEGGGASTKRDHTIPSVEK